MSIAIVAPPTSDPVTVDEVKAFARVTSAAENAVIGSAIKAVTSWLAGPDGWLGRSLCDQTLELTVFDPWGPIVLPRPPFLEIVSVTYPSVLGDMVAVSSLVRRTWRGEDGLTRIAMLDGLPWPSLTSDQRLVVTYRAGYGTALTSTPRSVDPAIRQSIIALAARVYDDRDSRATLADPDAREMFAPFRVWTP